MNYTVSDAHTQQQPRSKAAGLAGSPSRLIPLPVIRLKEEKTEKKENETGHSAKVCRSVRQICRLFEWRAPSMMEWVSIYRSRSTLPLSFSSNGMGACPPPHRNDFLHFSNAPHPATNPIGQLPFLCQCVKPKNDPASTEYDSSFPPFFWAIFVPFFLIGPCNKCWALHKTSAT
ncbi:hypothetical protein I7I50_09857 [Histoplasma capsulatum G186AR]|uniref:Uncharacterized protein n=1 Tax=Ajellomyces capsulatus TaxID=5037 RepID=A0A8H7YXF7_AJECA|nr:hypothetical protein I7I52_10826 [Histoplasma capsulatum]QSS68777.1 hypothetical protein I7I50_09857 [Histoplasma capsulatum G186AR]